MKYLFIQVGITNGEYEYNSKSIHQVDSDVDAHQYGENHAATFYAGKADNDNGNYYFNGGEVATYLEAAVEITKHEYEVLKRFMLY